MFDISRIEDDEFYIDLGSMYGIPSKPSEVEGEPKVSYMAVPGYAVSKIWWRGSTT